MRQNPAAVPPLSRAMLASANFEATVAGETPVQRTLSNEERTRSLEDTMRLRPAGPLWVFAYGSLIWNPVLHYEERRDATLSGWHRAFCLTTRAGRGAPDRPGLVLALDEGGRCDGIAYRLAEEDLALELAMLWRREMLFGSYVPRWVTLEDRSGNGLATALTFVANRTIDRYEPRIDRATAIHRLATARGSLGSSAQYLFQTRDALLECGILDDELEALAADVEVYRGRFPDLCN
jgi:cation transport protein ChaC